MSENLAARVRRVIAGSVNDLVDAIESANADGVMREAIRETERALDDVRSELGQAMARRHQTARHIEKLREKISEFGNKASMAVTQGRDDLAEAAILRQIDLERQIPVHEATLIEVAKTTGELESYVAALNGRKSEMEADLAAFAEARRVAGVDAPAGTVAGAMQAAERRAEHAGKAFNRAMGGSVTGSSAPDMKAARETAEKLEELEKLDRSTAVSNRLAAVKAQQRG